MELLYTSEKLKLQCTNLNMAKKLFHGNQDLAVHLLSRINALQSADNLRDIVIQPSFHFHKLQNKKGRNLDGYFAIDIKSRKEQWRMILQPLDEDEKPYIPCNIDEIAGTVKIVEISEVSKHYE